MQFVQLWYNTLVYSRAKSVQYACGCVLKNMDEVSAPCIITVETVSAGVNKHTRPLTRLPLTLNYKTSHMNHCKYRHWVTNVANVAL